MFIKLLIIFATVPLIELAILIKLGAHIGIIPTIIMVAGTGIVGITLAKQQGYIIIKRIKNSLEVGQMPGDDLIGGLMILLGGAMLLTPGLITDITGFTLILPGSRDFFARLAKKKFKDYLRNKYWEV